MANPYRKVMYRLKEKWSIREIAELYVDRNFSMDLVSHITGIPLAPLSHILWDYHLPEVKSKYYTENFFRRDFQTYKTNACRIFPGRADLYTTV